MVPEQAAGQSVQVHVLGSSETGVCTASTSLLTLWPAHPGAKVKGQGVHGLGGFLWLTFTGPCPGDGPREG